MTWPLVRTGPTHLRRRLPVVASWSVAYPAPCPRGVPARYAGRRSKTFESVLGPLRLERAYYHCAACGAGVCPRDAALGLGGTSLSPALTRMIGVVGAMVSFAEGHDLLHDLAGVDVSTTHVERAAEALGCEIAADERRARSRPAFCLQRRPPPARLAHPVERHVPRQELPTALRHRSGVEAEEVGRGRDRLGAQQGP